MTPVRVRRRLTPKTAEVGSLIRLDQGGVAVLSVDPAGLDAALASVGADAVPEEFYLDERGARAAGWETG